MESDAAKIATLNDRFRSMALDVTFTQGVIHAFDDVTPLLVAIEKFDAFTADNDPHGEHDFGSIMWEGQKVFWKIDYYDQHLQYWYDPLSSACRRVMTVMLASEY